ncbi:MAG TPA: Ig-like domain-containing protein, partial [Candidatus Glassbacteria bacterium]|nr:Ig-like domain-containing protein [Candidatus Glassbacteria bacterium]
HPDMTYDTLYGMPYTVVGGDQPQAPISFFYTDESDPGPYPIPDDTPIEGGVNATGDRHTLVIDSTNCMLYEVFNIFREGPGWRSGGGAIFDLRSNAQRPDGWTSADAAGLSILAGVVQYDEVAAGEVNHAIRFTMDVSQRAYIYPATHYASPHTEPFLPPMGLRLRLKASYDISGFTGQAQVIARALKKYGIIMADNGGDWFFTGGRSRRWRDSELEQLKRIQGYFFEVVDTDRMVVSGKGERYNIRPGVNITFPPPDTTITGGDSLHVTAEAYDNDGSVALVEFFADNAKMGEDAAEPYEITWQEISAGEHVIAARATDNAGKTNTSWGIRISVAGSTQ